MYDNKESVLEDNAKVFSLAVSMLALTTQAFSMLRINKERALEELENDWTCTMALAEALQMHYQVPFRVGHNLPVMWCQKVAKTVGYLKIFLFETVRKSYEEITEKLEGKSQHLPLSEQEFRGYLAPENVVRSRVGTGAPSPTSTSKNLVSIAKQLEQDELLAK